MQRVPSIMNNHIPSDMGRMTPQCNPQAYFTDLLTRLVNGWPQKRIDELMPWHSVPERPP
jgi:hypothetical protein